MFKWLSCAAAVMLCVASTGMAIERDTERKIADAVRMRFKGDARFEVQKESKVNGISVYDLSITKRGDEASASVTEDGVFLLTGFPGSDNTRNLPADVKSLLAGMSWAKPEDVGRYERTTFIIDVKLHNRIYRLWINPLGNLIDIQSSGEVRRDDPDQWEPATDREIRDLTPRLKEYFVTYKLKTVRRDPDNPQFFFVDITDDKGGEAQVLMNAAFDIEWWRASVGSRQIPKVVEACVRHYFPEGEMVKAWRDQATFYQLEEKLAGGQSLQLRITPKGDVVRVRNGEGEDLEQAVTRRDSDRRRRQP